MNCGVAPHSLLDWERYNLCNNPLLVNCNASNPICSVGIKVVLGCCGVNIHKGLNLAEIRFKNLIFPTRIARPKPIQRLKTLKQLNITQYIISSPHNIHTNVYCNKHHDSHKPQTLKATHFISSKQIYKQFLVIWKIITTRYKQ